jgi:UDP-N-acetylmuramoylalanine--D-glutamate ligase
LDEDFRGKKVLVIGAARQGTALARFLSTQGHRSSSMMAKPPEQLAEIAAQMAELPVQICFGEHPLTLLENCDLVCVSGGVPLTLPIILEAQKRAIPLSNDSQSFSKDCTPVRSASPVLPVRPLLYHFGRRDRPSGLSLRTKKPGWVAISVQP